jgi:hypothetical protein
VIDYDNRGVRIAMESSDMGRKTRRYTGQTDYGFALSKDENGYNMRYHRCGADGMRAVKDSGWSTT